MRVLHGIKEMMQSLPDLPACHLFGGPAGHQRDATTRTALCCPVSAVAVHAVRPSAGAAALQTVGTSAFGGRRLRLASVCTTVGPRCGKMGWCTLTKFSLPKNQGQVSMSLTPWRIQIMTIQSSPTIIIWMRIQIIVRPTHSLESSQLRSRIRRHRLLQHAVRRAAKPKQQSEHSRTRRHRAEFWDQHSGRAAPNPASQLGLSPAGPHLCRTCPHRTALASVHKVESSSLRAAVRPFTLLGVYTSKDL